MCGNEKSEMGSSFIAMEWIKKLSSSAQTDIWFHNLFSAGSIDTGSILHKVVLEDKTAPS